MPRKRLRKSIEEQVWDQLVEEAGEDLVEAASQVNVAQAEKELAEAGFDVAAERARAEAFLASLEGAAHAPVAEAVEAVPQAAPSKEKLAARAPEPKKKRVPAAVWAVAAAVAAGGAAAIYAETRPDKSPPPAPAPSPSPVPSLPAPPTAPDLLAAHDMRQRAAVAFDEGRVDECLSLLDQAREKDPAGDETPDVTKLRDKARRELEAKPR
jgi:hypothetical protein